MTAKERVFAAASILYALSMYWTSTLIILAELSLVGQPALGWLEAGGLVVFVGSSLLRRPDMLYWLTLFGLFAGHLLIGLYRLGTEVWLNSVTANVGILVLFAAIPFLSVPMSDSRYLAALKRFIESRSISGRSKFVLLVFLHLCMTIVMNIASIPALQRILKRLELAPRYLTRLYTAGYASYMVFSPFDGVVNMVLLLASVTYGRYVFAAIPMVVAIVTVSALLLPRGRDGGSAEESGGGEQEPAAAVGATSQEPPAGAQGTSGDGPEVATFRYRALAGLVAHVIAMIALAVAGNLFLHFRTPVLMTAILIATYALLWSTSLGKFRLWAAEIRTHGKQILEYRRFLPFLLAMNFFGAVLARTPLKEGIGSAVHLLSGLPQYVSLLLVVAATALLSLAGVHMMIVVTALGFAVAPAALGLTPPAFALFLLTCWYVAMSISPFVPFSAVVGEAIGEKPLTVSMRYNRGFAIAMLLIGPAVVIVANNIIGRI